MPYQCPKLKFLGANSPELMNLDLQQISNLLYCHDLVEFCMPSNYLMLKGFYLDNSKLRSLNLLVSAINLKYSYINRRDGLVELHMSYPYPDHKYLYLCSSKLRTLDSPMTSDLEILSLKECHDLEELHGSLKLKSLMPENSNLNKVNLGRTTKKLSLEGCHDLSEFPLPYQCPNLKSFSLNYSKLRTLDFRMSLYLETLRLEECRELVELNMPNRSPLLKYINLKTLALRNLNLGSTPRLEMLSLEGCHDLVELQMPFQCPKLKILNLKCSKLRILNHVHTPDLERLSLEGFCRLLELHMPNECPNLNLGSTSVLEMLSLEGCHDLVELHMPFRCPKLNVLGLDCSKPRTLYHVHTPGLEMLSLEECRHMLELHMPNECLKLKSLSLNNSQLRSLNSRLTSNLERLNIKECFNLVELRAPIGCLEKLDNLDLRDYSGYYGQFRLPVGSLHVIAESLDICPMHSDSILPKFQISCSYEEPIFTSIGNVGKFISIGVCPFTNLESFSSSTWDLQGLRKLTLEGSIPEVPKDLDRLQTLKELSLLSTTIKDLPDSICMLKNLKLLELNSCSFIEMLPEGLGLLECLEDLNLTSCIRLQDIPKSICDMKRLKCLNLSSCFQVKKLPRELRRLKCLKELNIEDTGINISDLPDGILELRGLHIVGSDGFQLYC